MATIKDIAKLVGVSKSTVSRVVSNSGFVKQETREQIEAVMKELKYKPNIFAKGMRSKKSFSIGIIFPELSNSYFTEWYEHVEPITRRNEYLNYICITDPQGDTEGKRLEDLLARNIDGLILFSYCKRKEVVDKLHEISKHTPVICCDSMMADTGLSCVYADGERGTYDAVEYLIQNGRKRIAYIRGKQVFTVIENRYKGYQKALEANGLPMDKDLVYESKFKRMCGYKAAQRFMNLSAPPNAIVSSTDEMAVGVLDYLNEKGIPVPQQVAVIGCNNQEVSKHTKPSLTTVAWPIKDLATETINTLVRMIEHKETKKQSMVFNCELIHRDSTRFKTQ